VSLFQIDITAETVKTCLTNLFAVLGEVKKPKIVLKEELVK
jgi:hypothetical protein